MKNDENRSGMMVVAEGDVTSRCRCVNKPGEYMILPRANRVEHCLPGMQGIQAQVLATPRLGAAFVEHELLIHPGVATASAIDQDLEQFLFVLEGRVDLALGLAVHQLTQGSYAWLPPNYPFKLRNASEDLCRALWIRRRYDVVESIAIPDPIVAHERDVPARPTDTYMEKHLTPYEDPGFDMGINLQTFDPGVYFSFVEAHVMEHGLYMLSGCGLYWLNQNYHEVQKDDFIYMAPYCPQFFYATGWQKAAYLLYKDVNRDYDGQLLAGAQTDSARASR